MVVISELVQAEEPTIDTSRTFNTSIAAASPQRGRFLPPGIFWKVTHTILTVAVRTSVHGSIASLQADGHLRGEPLGVMYTRHRFFETTLFSILILLVALLTRCRISCAQSLSFQSGVTPADSQAVQTIYEKHQAAQIEVVDRLGSDPDLRKLVCASTSLAGFATKNSSIHLTPTLKTRNALSGFKDVGVPIYDTCQVRARPACALHSSATILVFGGHNACTPVAILRSLQAM